MLLLLLATAKGMLCCLILPAVTKVNFCNL